MRNPVNNALFACLWLLIAFATTAACKRATSAEKPASKNAEDRLSITVSKADKSKKDSATSSIKTTTRCPGCGEKKLPEEELCVSCANEVSNTCYRCGVFELDLNGKLCSRCSRYYCALCNKRKQSHDDELCTKCHNDIETRGRKRAAQ